MPSSMSSKMFCNMPSYFINLFICKYQKMEAKQVHSHIQQIRPYEITPTHRAQKKC